MTDSSTVEYDKLVRDRIPAIIEANGERPVVHEADDTEYERRLLEKIREETEEFRESGDVDELADLLEVVFAIGKHHGHTERDLQARRDRKARRRGRFEDRIVLEAVES